MTAAPEAARSQRGPGQKLPWSKKRILFARGDDGELAVAEKFGMNEQQRRIHELTAALAAPRSSPRRVASNRADTALQRARARPHLPRGVVERG